MMLQPLLAAALIAAQTAPAPAPCVTRQEAGDMAIAFLPVLVAAAAQRCRPHLAAGAFLASRAEPWLERLRREAEPRRQSALRGLAKVTETTPPAGLTGEAGFDFIAALISSGMIGDVTPEACADIDALAESVSPLPPENVARIVASTLSLATSSDAPDAPDQPAAAGAGRRRPAPMICRS